jgi:hypothetical protein
MCLLGEVELMHAHAHNCNACSKSQEDQGGPSTIFSARPEEGQGETRIPT